ncbi:MAG: DUF3392 family protein [Proteobacteria bacterium]|nr:DUF3392 family protein [Pseudomonadota bacterium]
MSMFDNLPEFLTVAFWNQLGRANLPELVMVLTAAVVVLLDRYVRQLVHKFTSSHGAVFRFFTFLLVCSIGYASVSLGTAWLLRSGLMIERGSYVAPISFGILLIVAIEAQRQRQS